MKFQSEEHVRQQAIQARSFHPTGEWTEFPYAALDGSIVARFEAIVMRYPNRLAVKMADTQLTYAELNAAANRLAHAILAQRGEGAEPIAFLLEQGMSAIVAILAILKSGKFYVALEPTHPPARIAATLADTQSMLLITNHQQRALAAQLTSAGQTTLNLEQLAHHYPITNPAIRIAHDAIAYLVYTSGTTGTPKGVIESQRNVLHFTRILTNSFHVCPEDRAALTGSNSFSGAASMIYPALLNGAALFPFDLSTQDFRALGRWLRDEAITEFLYIPAPFRQLMATLDDTTTFPHLRILGLGADRVKPADIALYHKHFSPNCVLRISLGLSEKKNVAQYLFDQDTPLPAAGVPVGYCVEETSVLLVNEQGAPVGPGEIGEIVVQSRYLSPGYWRQPELTAARFRPAPDNSAERLYYTGDLGLLCSDGCLFHMGRKDHQVKIRGVRVETAEIEQALWVLGGLKEVVVTARPDAQGEPRLVAYLVPATMPAPTVTSLRCGLATTLPTALIPEAFVWLAAMPVNANGKVDLRALPDPTGSRPIQAASYAPPQTPLETTLVTIWQEVLGVQPVGIHDHFLDLGGNSLRAMQVHARLREHLPSELPAQLFLTCATIAELALLVTQQQARQLEQAELAQLLTALEALPAVSAQIG